MADGSSGGLSGILFEAGKTISDAGKKQVQQVGNQVVNQFGIQKPVFGGQNNNSGSFIPKPSGSSPAGQMPKLDTFGGGLGQMFEKNKPGSAFGKTSPASSTPQYSQEDLDKMAAENKAKDEEEIFRKQAELKQLQKQLHDENYYNAIRDSGKDLAEKERQRKEQILQVEEEQKQQQQAAGQQDILPGNPLAQNQQLGTPVAVLQAKTQTEANRGTTG